MSASKFDDIRAQAVCNAIEKGMSRTAAAAHGRIGRSTLMEWLAKGRDGEEPYAAFFLKVKEAEAKAEATMVECIIRAAKTDNRSWQAAAWWLERCRPAEYSKRDPSRMEESERAEPSGLNDIELTKSVLAALESREEKKKAAAG